MNKMLITVIVPSLDEKYDLFIPINKKVGTIRNVIIKSINEITDGSLPLENNLQLFDKESCKMLDNNSYVKGSGIVNGSILMLV